MRRPLAALPLVALLAAACDRATAPADPLRITRDATQLSITNTSARAVYFRVHGRKATTLMYWTPCVDPQCPSLAPGATARVSYPSPLIPAEEEEAVVIWWTAKVRPGAAPTAGETHAIVVPLE